MGVQEVLKTLKEKGKKLIIVTGKLEETTKKILEYFNILHFFDLVVGATNDSTRIKKKDIMDFAINSFENIDKSKSIMIGDRPSDVKAGIDNNMDSIAVLYGMGKKEDFNDLNVTYYINTPSEMLDIIK